MMSHGCAAVMMLIVAVLLTPARASAHAMHYTLEDPKTVRVFKAGFSGGETAGYAECVIHGPGPGPEFQNGRTDAHGRFAFVPDRDGVWRVEVDGGMGHRLAFEIPVNSTDAAEGRESAPVVTTEHSTIETMVRAGLGISLIANLFLLPAVLRKRKNM